MIQSPPSSPQMNTETRLPKKHKIAIIFTASSCFFVSSTLLVLYVANAAAVLPLNVAAFLSLYSPIVICALIVTISAVASATAISSYKSNEKRQAESVEKNNNPKSPTPTTTVSAAPPPPPPPPPGGFFPQNGPAQNGAGATTGGMQNASSGTNTKPKKPHEVVDRNALLEEIRGVRKLRKTSERKPLPPKKPDEGNTQDELQQKLGERRKAMVNTSDSESCSDSNPEIESSSGWSSSDEEDNRTYTPQPFQKSTENGAAALQSKPYYKSSSRDSGLFSEEDSDSWQSPINENEEDSPSQKSHKNGGTASDQKSPDKSVISSSKTAPLGSTDVKNYQQPPTEKPNSSNNGVNTSTKKETPPAVPTSVNNSSFSVRKRVAMFGG